MMKKLFASLLVSVIAVSAHAVVLAVDEQYDGTVIQLTDEHAARCHGWLLVKSWNGSTQGASGCWLPVKDAVRIEWPHYTREYPVDDFTVLNHK